ncbi:MAG: helix-turn-helix domain-containing protein [Mycobacterium sp.]
MVSIGNAKDSDHLDDRILRAAESCVQDFGLERVTVAEIARRARVSRPTVYRRWPDVFAILAAMFTRRVIAILKDVPGGPSERSAIVERSVAAVSRMRHDPVINAGLRHAPEMTLRYISERLGPGQIALIKVLAVDLATAQENGSVRAGDPERMAAMMMVVAQSAVQSAGLVEAILDEDALDAEFAYLLNSYLS